MAFRVQDPQSGHCQGGSPDGMALCVGNLPAARSEDGLEMHHIAGQLQTRLSLLCCGIGLRSCSSA